MKLLRTFINDGQKLSNLVLVASGLCLVASGIGVAEKTISIVGLVVSIIAFLLLKFLKRKIDYPPGSLIFLIFVVLLVMSLSWSIYVKSTLDCLLLFEAGGLFWLIFYNLQDEIEDRFYKLLIALGFVFGLVTIYYLVNDPMKVLANTLVLPYSMYRNHNHIGDYWALIIVIGLYFILKDYKNRLYYLFLPFGAYFLYISQSRSALVSVIVALVYLADKFWKKRSTRYLILVTLFSISVMFLVLSSRKTTIFSRLDYYLQSVLALVENPVGVGMGNFYHFAQSSQDRLIHFELEQFSSIAHNIFLEVVAGLGVLSAIFVIWFIQVVREFLSSSDFDNKLYKAIFLALSANFFFDITYFVPAMVWLWFMSLGLAQKKIIKS